MRRLPNLVLIGFMAYGKTTVGRRCASALGYRFLDTDTWVEERAGKTVARIFAEDGEEQFRSLESQAVQALSSDGPIVLSTGGGVPLDLDNVRSIKSTGIVVLLTVSPETVLER